MTNRHNTFHSCTKRDNRQRSKAMDEYGSAHGFWGGGMMATAGGHLDSGTGGWRQSIAAAVLAAEANLSRTLVRF